MVRLADSLLRIRLKVTKLTFQTHLEPTTALQAERVVVVSLLVQLEIKHLRQTGAYLNIDM